MLKKSPDNVILHTATKDSVNNPSRMVLDNILSLKHSIEMLLPNAKVCIPDLITRTDNEKATLTFNKMNEHLPDLQFDIIGYLNIGVNCLNRSVVHLNGIGMGKSVIYI